MGISYSAVRARHPNLRVKVPHLPNEILIEILSHLTLSRDLASFALVSRNFAALAHEPLYRSLQLNICCPEEDARNYEASGKVPQAFERFSRLIDHLSADPELGLRTVALSLTARQRLWADLEEHQRLMRCLPNLRHVTLSPPLRSFISTNRHLFSITLDFQYLSEHNYWDDPRFLETGELPMRLLMKLLRGYLWLPKLHMLQIENLDFYTKGVWIQNWAPRPENLSSLEDLRFFDYHDTRSGNVLANLFEEIKALKRFVFVTNSSTIFKDSTEDRHPALWGIMGGLKLHRTYLEEIGLSPRDGTYGKTLLPEWFFNYSFPYLRRVAVPQCLLDQDLARRSQYLLPSTLEEVQVQFTTTVEDCVGPEKDDAARQGKVAAVEWFAEAKLRSLPKLKRVIWWYQACELENTETCDATEKHSYYGSLPELQRLRALFTNVGVDFEWVSTPLFNNTPFGRQLAQEPVL